MRLDEQNRVLITYRELVPDVISLSAYKSAVYESRIKTVERGGRGRCVEIIYNTMSDSYKRKVCDVLGDPEVILGVVKSRSIAVVKKDKIPFSELTPNELSVCNARYNMVKCMRAYAEANKLDGITRAKREFAELVNSGLLCKESFTIIGKVSFPTLERWNKELKQGDDMMDVLVPERRQKTGTSILLEEHKTKLKELYLLPNKYTYAICYRFASRMWKLEGLTIPSDATCRRFLDEWSRQNIALVRFTREGWKAVKDSQLPYLERDPNSIQFMDVLVADGRKMDFQIAHPDTGKPCRPTLLAWQDMRTKLVLGFELMITENTMSVVSSFRQACINAGRLSNHNGAILPRSVYMDNGRAFKNKLLNGENPKKGAKTTSIQHLFSDGTDLETQVGGMFERLKPFGLEHVQYAKPYNAQSKVIERSFADFAELDRLVPSYVGNSIANKPARLLRNEVFHNNEYEKAVSKSGLPTLWGVYKFIEWWVKDLNSRNSNNSRYLNGHSPISLAAEQLPNINFSNRLLAGNSLDYMMMNSKTMKRRRNGFKINGVSYYNLQFVNVDFSDVEYIVKYDVLDSSRVLVFHEDGKFWCEATPWIGQDIHAMAALGSAQDRQKRNEALRACDSIEKSIKSAAKSHQTDMTYLEKHNAPQLSEPNPLAILPQEDKLQLKYF